MSFPVALKLTFMDGDQSVTFYTCFNPLKGDMDPEVDTSCQWRFNAGQTSSADQDILDNSMFPTLWEQFGAGPFLFLTSTTIDHLWDALEQRLRVWGNGLAYLLTGPVFKTERKVIFENNFKMQNVLVKLMQG